MNYRIEALDNWPHKDSVRRVAPFRMTFTKTLALVRKEAGLLGLDDGKPLVLRLVTDARQIRKDGMLRQDAWVSHPGVVLHVAAEAGPLEFATDRYEYWRDNLHAIALSLTALRGVDRWGVTHGAQYAGFKALPSGRTGIGSPEQAQRVLRDLAVKYGLGAAGNSELFRRLALMLHPDRAGPSDDWERLNAARMLLAAAGQL